MYVCVGGAKRSTGKCSSSCARLRGGRRGRVISAGKFCFFALGDLRVYDGGVLRYGGSSEV